MAPEHIEACLRADRWGEVGAAVDIYGLGLVLRELLTGRTPEPIPDALEAIIGRCLRFQPGRPLSGCGRRGRGPGAVLAAAALDSCREPLKMGVVKAIRRPS